MSGFSALMRLPAWATTGAVALLIRLAYGLTRPGREPAWRDSRHYLAIADQLRLHGRFADVLGSHTVCGGEPLYSDPGLTAFWLPGYPMLAALLRAVFGTDARVLFAPNGVMGAAAVAMIAWTAGCHFGSRGAWLSGGLLALAPTQILFTGMASTECLSTLVFASLLSFGAAIGAATSQAPRKVPLLALGLVGGLGVLTRSNFVPMLLLTVLSLRLCGQEGPVRFDWLSLGLPIGVAGLCVAPWLARNYMTFGAPFYATNGGLNLLAGANELATGRFTLAGVPCLEYPQYTEKARDAIYRAMALDWIGTHPTHALRLTALKLAHLFNPFPSNSTGASFWLAGLYNVTFFSLAAWGAIRGLMFSGAASSVHRITLAALAGYALPILLTFAITRFRVPMEPGLALLAAASLRAPRPPGR